jgi:membrane associated rhomboid family serine protease
MNSWQSEIKLPEKPPELDYGYFLNNDKKPIKCDREALLQVIGDPQVKFIATPEYESFIVPGSDYFSLQPILKRRKSATVDNILMSLIVIAITGTIYLLSSVGSDDGIGSSYTLKLNMLIFGILPLLNSLYELFVIKNINENNFKNEAINIQFSHWISQKRVISIYIVTAIIILITLSQFITGFKDSIVIAGLVKPDTLAGEYWRILSGPLLHGGVMHIFFNATAIFIIGRMVIRITDFHMFSTVLLVSIIFGSLFSIYFIPEQTSVGVSGGILGLFGFVLIIAIKQRSLVPRNILKSMLNSLFLVAVLGVAATDIIDNAAHGGGLIGGIIMGLLLIRAKKQEIPYRSGVFITILGLISVGILLFGTILTFSVLY